MRDTFYATEIKTVGDEHGQTIERIFVKEHGRDEIRFSWWKDGRMIMRPLDLPEEELLPLLEMAIRKGVFSSGFLKELHSVLYDCRQEQPDTELSEKAYTPG